MQARRRLLMQSVSGGLDTSPIITDMGYRLKNGDLTLEVNSAACVTDLYSFVYDGDSSNRAVFVMYGTLPSLQVFTNGTYTDYWNRDSTTGEMSQTVNNGVDGIRFTLQIDMLDVCYAFLQQTGDILFAGKNSIYYGHRNVMEVN